MKYVSALAGAALSFALTMSGGVVAHATDLTPVAQMDPWAGFFAGAHVGYGSANRNGCWDIYVPAIGSCDGAPTSPVNFTFDYNQSGVLGGGQVGYNWTKGKLLLGIELNADLANLTGQLVDPLLQFTVPDPNNPPNGTQTISLFDVGGTGTWKSLVNLTAKIGATHNNLLTYVEGGFALGNFQFAGNSGCSFSQNPAGLVAGVGIDYKLGKHWSVDLKYDHTWMSPVDSSCFVNTVLDNLIGPVPTQIQTLGGIDTVKLGFNYQFGS